MFLLKKKAKKLEEATKRTKHQQRVKYCNNCIALTLANLVRL